MGYIVEVKIGNMFRRSNNNAITGPGSLKDLEFSSAADAIKEVAAQTKKVRLVYRVGYICHTFEGTKQRTADKPTTLEQKPNCVDELMRSLAEVVKKYTSELDTKASQLSDENISLLKRVVELEKKLIENKRSVLYLSPFSMTKTGRGWVVVDTTWKRGRLSYNSNGCLSSNTNGPTLFASREDAEKAIEDTRNYKYGVFAWSNNNYVAVEV